MSIRAYIIRSLLLAAAGLGAVLSGALLRAGEFQITEAQRKHWSLQPVGPVAVPVVKGTDWAKTDVDRFILARLEQANVKPVGFADRRTLIRRATFDLTGLPPTPEAVEAFVNDPAPDAWPKLIDTLLASPAYGERWGRHWLDLARYADTAGETGDFPAPLAWRYRNWVIDAFNSDLPYDQFIQQQLAGDILAAKLGPDSKDGEYARLVIGTGYLGVARRFGFKLETDHYLTIEDTIDNVGKTFLGMTVACARCHDHKYDPVSQSDYYGLYGIFASTRYPYPGCEKVNRPHDMVPLVGPGEMERIVKPYQQKLADADATMTRMASDRTAAMQSWKKAYGSGHAELARGDYPDGGSQAFAAGAKQSLDSIKVAAGDMIQLTVLPKANYGADSTIVELEVAEVGGQNRKWNISHDLSGDLLAANPHADRFGNPGVWWMLDVHDGPALMTLSTRNALGLNGLNFWGDANTPIILANSTEQPISAWTALFPPKCISVHPSPAGGVAVAWASPIDATVKVTGRVVDADNHGGDGIAWVLDQYSGDCGAEMRRLQTAAAASDAAKALRDQLAANAPKVELAYAVAEDKPHDEAIQLRGDPEKPGAVVPRRFLEILGGQKVADDATTSGRLQLAQWISSKDNPLTARVMVNRIWQHHFGQGLVKTSSDFGVRGQPPTNPQLLDWLAGKFVEGGWSMKSMHRLIMLSSAYQLSSDTNPDAYKADPANDLRWHFDRRRLSAEEIRDSLLVASGDLDPVPGGPHPFPPESTWGFSQHAPFSAVYDNNKRSIYLMVQRLKRHPFLALFDGADPNSSTPERMDTTVPTQALYFMNDPFVHQRSISFAEKLLPLKDDALRIDRAYRLCFGRAPTNSEIDSSKAFLAAYYSDLKDMPDPKRTVEAWAAYLRVMFGSNEMVYVD